jgi:hypothetical protein
MAARRCISSEMRLPSLPPQFPGFPVALPITLWPHRGATAQPLPLIGFVVCVSKFGVVFPVSEESTHGRVFEKVFENCLNRRAPNFCAVVKAQRA